MDRYQRFSRRINRTAEDEERYIEIDEIEGRRKDGDVGSDMTQTRDVFCQTDISMQDMNNVFKANVDEKTFYAGVPNFLRLAAVFSLVEPNISTNQLSSLTTFQQFMVLPLRITLNLTCKVMAYRLISHNQLFQGSF